MNSQECCGIDFTLYPSSHSSSSSYPRYETTMFRNEYYHFKVFVFILALIIYHNSIRDCNFLLREAILPPSKSPWHYLYHKGDPSSFLFMTGLTQEAFNMLHDIVKPPGHPSLPRRKGRKWSLSSEGQLGLLLFYICSTMNNKYLCLIFGVTPNAWSCILRNRLKIVVPRLRFHPAARIQFPSAEKMQLFASMVCNCKPTVDNVIGFMDGVLLATECTSEKVMQNAFYSGYQCDTMINNVFGYGPHGKVFITAINFPGSWVDGSVSV